MWRVWQALLTGILIFVSLIVLDALNIWPHSVALRTSLVGGLSGAISWWVVRQFAPRT